MRRLVSAAQMKAADNYTINYYGIGSLVLMERAALACCDEISKIADEGAYILVVCGPGNNGADGYAVARILADRGFEVKTLPLYPPKSRECIRQAEICEKLGIPSYERDLPREKAGFLSEKFDICVDASFGIGLSREADPEIKDFLNAVNNSRLTRVAVDMPGFADADRGKLLGTAFKADLTVTFQFGKIGQYLYPAKEYCGKVVVRDVGIYAEDEFELNSFIFEKEDINACIKPLALRSNKGSCGKLLIAAGSYGMAGASVLCAKAALRTGCGLVKVLCPEENRQILQTKIPEAVLLVYRDEKEAIELLRDNLTWADALVIGPGLSTDQTAKAMVYHALENSEIPMVIDADALNIISKNPALLKKKKAKCVVTPHFGEMARLTGKTVEEISESVYDTAVEFSKENDIVCVLKDAATVTAYPEGRTFINTAGNPGMATAGSGDVLSGIMGAFYAKGVEEAEGLAVYVHSLAGDAAAKDVGEYSLMAGDIIRKIPTILNFKNQC